MAVPGSIFSRYSEGTNNLIRKGCPAALCCGDVIKALEPETDGQQEEKPKRKPEKKTTENRKSETKKPAANGTAPAGMSPEESAVDMALKKGKDSFEEIAAVTGIDEKRLRSVLTMMEIKNMISRMPGQRYIRL